MTIGERIREARDRAGWTQAEAAGRAGMHQSAWARYEAGRRTPGVEVLVRMAAAIGCPLAGLLPTPTP